VEGAVAILADIQERIHQELLEIQGRERLEEEVQQTSNELGQTRAELRALAARLMTAEEQERRRLARELHDDLGQRLALLTMRANNALERLQKNPQESEALFQGVLEELSVANREVRELSHGLHPSIIEHLGLPAALRNLVASCRDGGFEVGCWVPDQIPPITLDTATALYRIAQEAIRNAQQHANGAPIHVTLTAQDNSLRLAVLDSGPGFDLGHARVGGGLGLLSMQERARLVNGTLLIKARPGDGTEVSVSVPVEFPS
jgi:two-component system CheB/CheR fusion protein